MGDRRRVEEEEEDEQVKKVFESGKERSLVAEETNTHEETDEY